MKPIRVLIADDHTLVRESLVSVLNASGECQVVGEAADGVQAIEKALALQPDVVIVDVSMPHLNGVEVVRRLRAELPQARTLVLTMHEDEEYVLHMVRAGASGYVVKDSPMTELIAAVRALRDGRAHFDPAAAKVLAEQIHRPDKAIEDPYGRLTAREREVFHLVIEGLTTKAIAARLQISTKTAENHRARVLEKLGARNAAEVVRYAVRKGLLDK